MDDELKTLETELSRLRPADPTPALTRRIEAALSQGRPTRWRAAWFWGLLLPAAAAAAVILLLAPAQSPERAGGSVDVRPGTAARGAAPLFKPVAVENVLYSAEDEGIVTLADGTPARRERLQYVDTITWRDARSNASLRWTVPREEVRFVPVSFQ